MCKFASFVLTKDGEFYTDDDSHENIISTHKLHADGIRGTNVLRVELIPGPNTLDISDFGSYVYNVDQDTLPEWHNAPECEVRTRAAILRRYPSGIVTKAGSIDVREGASLTANALTKAGYVYVGEGASLTANALTKAGSIDVREGASLTANALTEVAGSIYVWKGATLIAPLLKRGK